MNKSNPNSLKLKIIDELNKGKSVLVRQNRPIGKIKIEDPKCITIIQHNPDLKQ